MSLTNTMPGPESKLRLAGVTSTSGGVEVYLDANPEDTQVLMLMGRQAAINKAREAGHQVNAISSETGPFPVDRSTGQMLVNYREPSETSQLAIKTAMEAKKLVYRQKYVLTFLGG